MRGLNTFGDVAVALREAEDLRRAGELRSVTWTWVQQGTVPPGACAVGGIALVAGAVNDKEEVTVDTLRSSLPILDSRVINPMFGSAMSLLSAMSMMNTQGWSWGRIAEWLDSLEGDPT